MDKPYSFLISPHKHVIFEPSRFFFQHYWSPSFPGVMLKKFLINILRFLRNFRCSPVILVRELTRNFFWVPSSTYFSQNFVDFWANLSKFYFLNASSFDFCFSIEYLRKFSKEILFLISTSNRRFWIHFFEIFHHFSRIAKIKYVSFWDSLKIWRSNRIYRKPVLLSTWKYFLLIDVLFLRKHYFFHNSWSLSFSDPITKVLSIVQKYFSRFRDIFGYPHIWNFLAFSKYHRKSLE